MCGVRGEVYERGSVWCERGSVRMQCERGSVCACGVRGEVCVLCESVCVWCESGIVCVM